MRERLYEHFKKKRVTISPHPNVACSLHNLSRIPLGIYADFLQKSVSWPLCWQPAPARQKKFLPCNDSGVNSTDCKTVNHSQVLLFCTQSPRNFPEMLAKPKVIRFQEKSLETPEFLFLLLGHTELCHPACLERIFFPHSSQLFPHRFLIGNCWWEVSWPHDLQERRMPLKI